MKESITINGNKYTLDIERAQELGVLEQEKRDIVFKDLKNGDVFRWRRISKNWNKNVFVMVNNTIQGPKQCVELSANNTDEISVGNGWFSLSNTDIIFSVWDNNKIAWIDKI